MDLNLDGKVAVIAGASKGIGAASARVMAAEGAKIFLLSRDEGSLKKFAAEFQGDVAYATADLTKDGDAEIAVKKAIDVFGRIDILVNSAGASQGGIFWDIPDQVWDESFNLKLMGTIRMIRAVIPTMRAQKYGRIVTIVGNAGRQPFPRALPGSAANAALLAITKGLSEEVAEDGITINAINPGPTKSERWNIMMENLAQSTGTSVDEVEAGFTDKVPLGRLGEVEEIGRLVAFLASDLCANMTGTSITSDGGMTKAIA